MNRSRILEIGVLKYGRDITDRLEASEMLGAGDIGYIIINSKDITQFKVGETISTINIKKKDIVDVKQLPHINQIVAD